MRRVWAVVDFGSLLTLGALLFVKHLAADGPLQTTWQVRNKGVFLHPAGLIHAGVHVGLTAAALILWSLFVGTDAFDPFGRHAGPVAAILGLEFVVHYAVDWIKCRLDAKHHWSSVDASGPEAGVLRVHDVRFFYAFLADQTCHSLTYLAILYGVAAALGVG